MRTTVAQILIEVSEKHGIPVADLKSTCRRREYAWPRQEAYFRVFTECPHISYTEMARRIGDRDHTTCISGVKRYCSRIGIAYDEAQRMRAGATGAIHFAKVASAFGHVMEQARAA